MVYSSTTEWKKKLMFRFMLLFTPVLGILWVIRYKQNIIFATMEKPVFSQMDFLAMLRYRYSDYARMEKAQGLITMSLVFVILLGISWLLYTLVTNRKIEICEDGFAIYGVGKNPALRMKWEEITSIRYDYATGLNGLLGRMGLTIKGKIDGVTVDNFIHMYRFKDRNEIKDIIYSHMKDREYERIDVLSTYTEKTEKDDIINPCLIGYKNNFSIIITLSIISVIFNLINIWVKNTGIMSLLILYGSICYGIPASIGINIVAYNAFGNRHIEFDNIWNKAKKKLGKYIIIQLLLFVIHGGSLFIAYNTYKYVGLNLLGYTLLATLVLLFIAVNSLLLLLPYSVSITEEGENMFLKCHETFKKYSINVVSVMILEFSFCAIAFWIVMKDLIISGFTLGSMENFESYMTILFGIKVLIMPIISLYLVKLITMTIGVDNGGAVSED